MNVLRKDLAEYLAIRRTLGAKLLTTGAYLKNFVNFAEALGAEYITTDLALRWATLPENVQPAYWASRLSMVRLFAQYCEATDLRTEIPPRGLLPYRTQRAKPYIYSDEDICKIIQATKQLWSPKGLRAATFSTFFGLLAVTGIRMSEGINLDRSVVDLHESLLTILGTKFGKSRLIPLHPSTREALHQYSILRDKIFPNPAEPAFFLSERGVRITACSARYNFAKVSQKIGLREPAGGHGYGPRLHDMRHRFAVRTLIDWYQTGVDVERALPRLSTYLGHVHTADTYWYLTAVPDLLMEAGKRADFEQLGGSR